MPTNLDTVKKEFTIVNGSRDGESMMLPEDVEDGQKIRSPHIYPFRRIKDDMSVIHTRQQSMQRFIVFGSFVYYMGEEFTPLRID